ncbi:alginate lyase [Arcticibacter tournemirensis]|uniref:Polysaccharide lyase family 7 protein n=1 Tax=Arcticibacter tournemirensis TaxID=699437 RepID=A0A5M9H8M2_9SPHI|nr:polysaccharide lyase family 7 protein [Arcticibacter tournemirensis]KAA8482221.1 polysaccharide lyase family 7 protein [Arcticibacter tournemirensis]TQM52359.1 alginate lyase [Arcticibacter tournemirensis]
MNIILSIFFFILTACSKKESAASGPVNTLPGKNESTPSDTPGVYPAKVLDLTNWKLTLPVNTDHAGNPDEIKQPELNTYSSADYFHVNKGGDGVVFRAQTGGATTSGSNFPRSELREMLNNGKTSAAWSSSEGTHTLFIDQRVTHLPDVRKHIVIGQIHDADKYVIFFRLEDRKLLVSVNGGSRITLDDNYQLGTRFSVKFVVANDKTQCYYNEKLKYTFEGHFTDAYFKAGAYVQSSCQGAKKVAGESCTAYGEVEIFNVWTKHE